MLILYFKSIFSVGHQLRLHAIYKANMFDMFIMSPNVSQIWETTSKQ